jgi:hypothetical protein
MAASPRWQGARASVSLRVQPTLADESVLDELHRADDDVHWMTQSPPVAHARARTSVPAVVDAADVSAGPISTMAREGLHDRRSVGSSASDGDTPAPRAAVYSPRLLLTNLFRLTWPVSASGFGVRLCGRARPGHVPRLLVPYCNWCTIFT